MKWFSVESALSLVCTESHCSSSFDTVKLHSSELNMGRTCTSQALLWLLPTVTPLFFNTVLCTKAFTLCIFSLLAPLLKWLNDLSAMPGRSTFGAFVPVTSVCLVLRANWQWVLERSLSSYAKLVWEPWMQSQNWIQNCHLTKRIVCSSRVCDGLYKQRLWIQN